MAEAFGTHRKERGGSLAGTSSRTAWGARRGGSRRGEAGEGMDRKGDRQRGPRARGAPGGQGQAGGRPTGVPRQRGCLSIIYIYL